MKEQVNLQHPKACLDQRAPCFRVLKPCAMVLGEVWSGNVDMTSTSTCMETSLFTSLGAVSQTPLDEN